MFCHGVTRFLHHYPYIISVCLTLTQMHLPQSLPLHRINGFARFFHGFISVLLLHSGHTSKPQFFHCFSIVSRVLYTIMVPHRSLNFSIVFPPHQFPSFYFYFTWHHFPSVLLKCSILFPLFYVIFPHFFHCFSHHFPLHCNLPKSTSEGGPGGIDTPTSPNCHLVHNPKKVCLWPPFLPPTVISSFLSLSARSAPRPP